MDKESVEEKKYPAKIFYRNGETEEDEMTDYEIKEMMRDKIFYSKDNENVIIDLANNVEIEKIIIPKNVVEKEGKVRKMGEVEKKEVKEEIKKGEKAREFKDIRVGSKKEKNNEKELHIPTISGRKIVSGDPNTKENIGLDVPTIDSGKIIHKTQKNVSTTEKNSKDLKSKKKLKLDKSLTKGKKKLSKRVKIGALASILATMTLTAGGVLVCNADRADKEIKSRNTPQEYNSMLEKYESGEMTESQIEKIYQEAIKYRNIAQKTMEDGEISISEMDQITTETHTMQEKVEALKKQLENKLKEEIAKASSGMISASDISIVIGNSDEKNDGEENSEDKSSKYNQVRIQTGNITNVYEGMGKTCKDENARFFSRLETFLKPTENINKMELPAEVDKMINLISRLDEFSKIEVINEMQYEKVLKEMEEIAAIKSECEQYEISIDPKTNNMVVKKKESELGENLPMPIIPALNTEKSADEER